MSLLNLFSGGLSSGLDFLGQYLNVGYQKELQEHAAATNYKYAQKYSLNSPSWNREGLINAGYNPLLAVQNATSGANASWTSTGQANPSDLSGAFSKGFANAQDVKRLDNESKQVEANVDAAYANADKAKAEKATLLERMPWISKREKAEIGNIEKDSLKKEAEIHNIDETTRYIEKNYELQKRLGEMGLDVQRINAVANSQSARANMLNATSGSPIKIINDKIINPIGRSNTYKKLSKYAKKFDNFIGSYLK